MTVRAGRRASTMGPSMEEGGRRCSRPGPANTSRNLSKPRPCSEVHGISPAASWRSRVRYPGIRAATEAAPLFASHWGKYQ